MRTSFAFVVASLAHVLWADPIAIVHVGNDWEAGTNLVDTINRAPGGYSFIVGPGTYKIYTAITNGVEQVGGGAPVKTLHVRSSDGPTTTIIDCQRKCRAFHFESYSYPIVRFTIAGFTVTNGCAHGSGGGILADASKYLNTVRSATNGILTNCIVRCCTAYANGAETVNGGGVCFFASRSGTFGDVTITDCHVTNLMQTAVSGAGGSGGGLYLYGSPYDEVMRNVIVRDCSVRMPCTGTLAGGCAYVSVPGWTGFEPHLHLQDCVFENGCLMPKGDAAGLYLAGSTYSGFTVTDCRVSGNMSNGGVGGMTVPETKTAARFVGCSFVHNVTTNFPAGVTAGNAAVFENCLFEGNTNVINALVPWGDTKPYGGGGIRSTSRLALTNCVFRANMCESHDSKSAKGGAICATSGSSDLNAFLCVFDGNRATQSSVYCDINNNAAANFDSCIFTGNVSTYDGCWDYGYIGLMNRAVLVRNCLATGNTGTSLMRASAFENCTVFRNDICPWAYADAYRGARAALELLEGGTITNCIVFSNGDAADGGGTQYNVAPMTGEGRISHSLVGEQNDEIPMSDGDVYGNFVRSAAEAESMYAPTDKGGMSLKRTALVRDRGIRMDWMQGSRDVGDGTYEMTFADSRRKTGMTLVLNNRHKRLVGENPDMGACEHYGPRGLVLMLR